jgi:hypothetical protein
LVTYLCLKCYFGWFDDFQLLHLLNGEVIHQPTGFFYLVVFNFIGEVFFWFYRHFDGYNWYGIFMYILIFLSILNINIILYYIISPIHKRGFLQFVFLALVLYTAYLIENVYLLNFTRVGLLLMFTSILCLAIFHKVKPLQTNKKWWVYGYLLVLFFIGISFRPPVSIVLLPIIGLFLFFYFDFKTSVKLNSFLAIFMVVYIAMSWITLSSEKKTAMRNVYQSERYMVNILDGLNIDSTLEKSIRDSIKLEALNSWYFADQDSLLNDAFLKKYGGGQSMLKQTIFKWKYNLKQEYIKASSFYTENYLPQLNWWKKSILFTIIILLIPLVVLLRKGVNRKRYWMLNLYYVLVILYILLITVVFKMEDRVLAPILIFLFLTMLVFTKKEHEPFNKTVFYFLLVLFGAIGVMRSFDYHGVSVQRADGLRFKEFVRIELEEEFRDKYIVFDFFTMLFLETTPFKDVNYSDKWITGIEVWNRHLPNIKNINEVVGCQKWPCYFEKIAQRPYDFIFFYKHERIAITESYFDIIYDYSLKFEDLSQDLIISKFHYSLHWVSFDFGYYRLEHMIPNDELEQNQEAL